MPSFWRSLLILSSTGLLALLLWHSPPQELTGLLEPTESGPLFPHIYLENSSTRQYKTNGKLNYRLNAAELYYFENESLSGVGNKSLSGVENSTNTNTDRIDYKQPQLWLYDDSGANSWKISSHSGSSDGKGKHIQLTGNVLIEQLHPHQTGAKLQTESLHIFPDSQYAETHKAVIIHDSMGTTKAIGLKAFFARQKIEFLSQVSGQYVLP
ncbi:MAG: LPS export ABC transporter periplasmic protein LptC [Cellvibrionaceae bacterium]|nr:LPS export ABC transporter periplasmic protein LptC [Cellvibrionaceae bacterium]